MTCYELFINVGGHKTQKYILRRKKMKKILVLVMALFIAQFIACKPSKTAADKEASGVEAQTKTVKKQNLSIKEKMESKKTFHEFGCRTEKDIYTFMEISESNWNIIRDSKSFTTEELDATLNNPVKEYFGITGIALRFAYNMKDYAPEDLYKASISILKTWFNSEDPNKWIFPDSGLF
jgi:hypothetical protein